VEWNDGGPRLRVEKADGRWMLSWSRMPVDEKMASPS